jgi:signal transduction histidine kinase
MGVGQESRREERRRSRGEPRPLQQRHTTALLLYSVLLVLPTLVLGGLQWRQLEREHQAELADVPEIGEDAARRLTAAILERLDRLVSGEDARPFYHYAQVYAPAKSVGDQLVVLPTPLTDGARPEGLRSWFVFDPLVAEERLRFGREPPLDVLPPDALEEARAARDYIERSIELGMFGRVARIRQIAHPEEVPIAAVAVTLANGDRLQCMREHLPALAGVDLPVTRSGFHLELYLGREGSPRLAATRRVFHLEDLPPLPEEADCVREPLTDGFALTQGFFIDPVWLFAELPVVAASQVLSEAERTTTRLVTARTPLPADQHVTPIDLVAELGLDVDEAALPGLGRVAITVDRSVLEARYRTQRIRFAAVALMLLVTLGTGMGLLLRTVSRELEQARRTENFVAAITHELRTPLSAIKLHAEMLLEGWTSDEARREEYYRRIARETTRLSTLVERVLEKARLSRGTVRPELRDLNELVRRGKTELEQHTDRPTGDIVFELDEDLPDVLLTREALTSILENLVENARKYASPSPESPVRVRTLREGSGAVLEVADRGPGVDPSERSRIFEAFYRVGDESTRRTRGTGLGLHLVAQYAHALSARVEVRENPGGGALFRVVFASG